MADVVLVLDEVLGQGVEQLGVGRRIGQREIVDRIDDADAEIVAPDAVDEAAGEERIVRRAHPVEQRDARVLALSTLNFGPPRAFGGQRRAGVGVRSIASCGRGRR